MLVQDELTSIAPNYSNLRRSLSDGDWRQADTETMELILAITGRTAEGYPKASDIGKISISDLYEIDRLWGNYSAGKFGFTPQRHIWLRSSQNYTDFCEHIGWRKGEAWLEYSELSFNTNAVMGHLPALMFPCPLGDTKVLSFALGSWRVALLSRKYC
jgi:hypothetical protein